MLVCSHRWDYVFWVYVLYYLLSLANLIPQKYVRSGVGCPDICNIYSCHQRVYEFFYYQGFVSRLELDKLLFSSHVFTGYLIVRSASCFIVPFELDCSMLPAIWQLFFASFFYVFFLVNVNYFPCFSSYQTNRYLEIY